MTKGELLKMLEPYDDSIEIIVLVTPVSIRRELSFSYKANGFGTDKDEAGIVLAPIF